MSMFSKNTPEERFWKWFMQNSDRLFNFELDQDRVFDELSIALERVADGLAFEFGPVQDGQREFIISADGDRDLFPIVERLVANAPPTPHWDVIAFRPPLPIEFVIDIAGHRLGPDDVWFQAEPDGDVTGLKLYIRGLSPSNKGELGQAAYILLDTALGEYATETLVGFIERHSLPPDPAACGLRPFREIKAAIRGYGH